MDQKSRAGGIAPSGPSNVIRVAGSRAGETSKVEDLQLPGMLRAHWLGVAWLKLE